MLVKRGSFTKVANSTAGATQDITGFSFVPKAIFFFTVKTTGADDTPSAGSHLSFGITDFTTAKSVSYAVDNHASPSSTAWVNSGSHPLLLTDGSGGVEAKGQVTTISGGFRITWDTNTNASAWRISYVAWGGNIDAKVVEWTLTTSGATQDVTSVGFQPKALINIYGPGTSTGTSGSGASIGCGFVTGSGNSQHAWNIASDDNAEFSLSWRFRDDGFSIISSKTDISNYDAYLSFNSFLSNGFRYNHDFQPLSALKIFTLALGGNGQNFKAAEFSSNTTTGNQTVSGVGFQPIGGIFTTVGLASAVGDEEAASISIGAKSDADGVDGYWTGERSSQTSSDAACVNNTNDVLSFYTVTGGNPVEATKEAVWTTVTNNSDGFVINVHDAPPSAYRIGYFVFSGIETTVVGNSLRTPYNLRKRVIKDHIGKYSTKSFVSKVLTPIYNIRNSRTKIIGFIYRVIQSAIRSSVHVYHNAGPTGKDLTNRYNTTFAVSRNLTPRYNIQTHVGRTYILRYNNRSKVILSRIMHYSIRKLATLSVVKRYRLGFTTVNRTHIHKYDNIVHPLIFIKKNADTTLTATGGDTEVTGLLKSMQSNAESSATLGITWTQSQTYKRLKWITSTIPNQTFWQGGTYTWRLRIASAYSGSIAGDIELVEIILRRLSADGVTVKASKSSGILGTPINLETTGVKTGTIVWNDGTQNPSNASINDRLEVVFRCYWDDSIQRTSNKVIYVGTNVGSGSDDITTPLTQLYTRGTNLISKYNSVTTVGKSLSAVYNRIMNVTLSRIMLYNMTGKVDRARILVYNVHMRTTRSISKSYGLGGPVGRANTHGYPILLNVGRNLSSIYHSRILSESSDLTAIYTNIGKAITDATHRWTMIAHTHSISRQPYNIWLPFMKEHSFRYHIRPRKTDVKTSDPLYSFPFRPRIYIKTLSNAETIYVYDAFVPENSLLKVTKVDFTLTESAASQFSITIEDSGDTVNLNRLGLGNRVIIQIAKFIDDYQNVISGFIRRIEFPRPETNVREIVLHGYGSQVRSNERITNFKRAADRERVASNIPRRDDESMRAANLVKDLWSTTDHLPQGEPLEQFTTTGVNPDVKNFIPSIIEDHVTFATVMDKIATTVGGMWSIDAYDDVRFSYPTQIHSGITIKDIVEPEDSAYTTGYILGEWAYEDSMEISDGFANRLYGRHGSIISSGQLSQLSNNSTPLFQQAVAMQFIPGSPAFTNLSLLLSKVGEPTGYIHGEILMDSGDNTPEGLPVAFFRIPYTELKSQAEQVYRLNLEFYTRHFQVDKPHWIVLYAYGDDEQNTARWHHNGDLTTEGVYSATRSPGDEFGVEAWRVSNLGPAYSHTLFESRVHVTEASDPYSILKYGLIEAVIDISWITEDETADRYLMNVLHFSAKPKRIYQINTVRAPDQPLLPGQLINIVDSKAGFKKDPPVMAEILEASYSFDANEYGLGTDKVNIRPVGYLEPFARIEPIALDVEEPDLPLEGTYLYEPGGIPIWLQIMRLERTDSFDSILKLVKYRIATQTTTISEILAKQRIKPTSISEPHYLVNDSLSRRQLLSHKVLSQTVLVSEVYFAATKLSAGGAIVKSITETVNIGNTTGNFQPGNFNANFHRTIASGSESLNVVRIPSIPDSFEPNIAHANKNFDKASGGGDNFR